MSGCYKIGLVKLFVVLILLPLVPTKTVRGVWGEIGGREAAPDAQRFNSRMKLDSEGWDSPPAPEPSSRLIELKKQLETGSINQDQFNRKLKEAETEFKNRTKGPGFLGLESTSEQEAREAKIAAYERTKHYLEQGVSAADLEEINEKHKQLALAKKTFNEEKIAAAEAAIKAHSEKLAKTGVNVRFRESSLLTWLEARFTKRKTPQQQTPTTPAPDASSPADASARRGSLGSLSSPDAPTEGSRRLTGLGTDPDPNAGHAAGSPQRPKSGADAPDKVGTPEAAGAPTARRAAPQPDSQPAQGTGPTARPARPADASEPTPATVRRVVPTPEAAQGGPKPTRQVTASAAEGPSTHAGQAPGRPAAKSVSSNGASSTGPDTPQAGRLQRSGSKSKLGTGDEPARKPRGG